MHNENMGSFNSNDKMSVESVLVPISISTRLVGDVLVSCHSNRSRKRTHTHIHTRSQPNKTIIDKMCSKLGAVISNNYTYNTEECMPND